MRAPADPVAARACGRWRRWLCGRPWWRPGPAARRRAPTCPARRPSASSTSSAGRSTDTLALIKAGQADAGLRRGQGRLPQPLRARRDPAAGRRHRADVRRRDQVRRDPRADPRRRADRRDPRRASSSCAACIDDAERQLTDDRRRRAGASWPASRSSSSSARASRSCCCCRSCSATSRRRKATQYRQADPRAASALAAVATRASPFFADARRASTSLPVGREVLEAITALVAVAVLFYVSFWLIARLEHKRWLEFVRARVWSAVSVGSTAVAGARRLHRRLPRGLRDGALLPGAAVVRRRASAGTILLGLGARPRRARRRGVAIFRLGRRAAGQDVPAVAVVLVMATSVAFLGNAVHALQAADVIPAPAAPAGRGCRSSSPRPPATGRPCRRSSPRSRCSPSTCSARCTCSWCGPACEPAVAPAGRRADRRRRPSSAADRGGPRRRRRRRHVHQGGRRRPADGARSSPRRSCRPPTTHADGVAAGVVDAVAERRRRGRRRARSSSSPTPRRRR